MNIQSLQIWKKDNRFFLKKCRTGQICPGLGRSSAYRPNPSAARGSWPIQTTGQRGPAVSGPGRPKRYAATMVVRSSQDRRPLLIVYAGKEWGGRNPRVSPRDRGGSPWASLVGREGGSGGCVGIVWSWVVVGEAGVAPGDGVVEGVLQVLRLGSAMATRPA
jgi:hypothetical protein